MAAAAPINLINEPYEGSKAPEESKRYNIVGQNITSLTAQQSSSQIKPDQKALNFVLS